MSKLYLKFRGGEKDLSLAFGTKASLSINLKGMATAVQSKTATPSGVEQLIVPDAGYLLSSVTVEAIPSYYGRIGYNGGVLTVW